MVTYSDMQKASRNYFRSCMDYALREFVAEVKKNNCVELRDDIEEIDDRWIEAPSEGDFLKIVCEDKTIEVSKEDYVEAFNMLSDTEKTIVDAYYYANATDQQIADALNKSRSAIWERRKGALKKMRRYLSEKASY